MRTLLEVHGISGTQFENNVKGGVVIVIDKPRTVLVMEIGDTFQARGFHLTPDQADRLAADLMASATRAREYIFAANEILTSTLPAPEAAS